MASVRLQSYALVALALMAGSGVAHAQVVQVRGTFNGVPFPPTCAPPAGENINFVLTPPPSQLQAQFACDTVPSRPLRFTCLPGELGGSGTGVSALFDVRASTGGVSELFVECPSDASTTVVNLEAAIQDLFVDRATYQANPGADALPAACLSSVGNATITRVSYSPDTRILSYDCLRGTTTSTVECFTWDGEPVSSTRSTSGLTYQVANPNILNVEDCIGFGANNDRALNSPALIPPTAVAGDVLFVDNFEPPAVVATATAITAITPTPATIGEPYTVAVSVGATGAQPRGAVLVSDAAGANCTVTLSAAGIGSCMLTSTAAGPRTIRATYAGRVGFDGSTVTAAQTVGIGTQTITFSSPAEGASITYSPSGTVPLVATGGKSGLPVVFSTTPATAATCTVTGNTLNIQGAGDCVIRANQAGNANYTAAPQVTRNVTIARAPQTITFELPNPLPTFVPNGTFTVVATGGASGEAVTFVAISPSVCAVQSEVVTGATTTAQIRMLSRSTCTLVALQAESENYLQAPDVTRNIAIQLGTQTISFNPPSTVPFLSGQTFAVSATGGQSSSPVVLTSLTQTICTVPPSSGQTVVGSTTSTLVTMVAAGNCRITALQNGDADFAPAPSVTRTIQLTTP